MAVNNRYLYSDITDKVIGAASKVHKELGPGLVEKLYQRALKIELSKKGVNAEREKRINMRYNGVNIGFDKVDFDAENKVLVEIKAVSELSEIHRAQMISYLKSSGRRVGLLINFGMIRLELKRIIV
ncbi:MAG: GxxExxY protein [Candidatus Levybacteria bacterium]|nr:GxxExxY protein [Candidatus Levybacteria bacterium]